MRKQAKRPAPLPAEGPIKKMPRQDLIPVPLTEKVHSTLLEKVLAFVMPQEEAVQVAGCLVRKFGSLSHVLAAPAQELMQTPGVHQKAAQLLAAVAEAARESLEEHASGIRRIFDTESAVLAMYPLFAGRRKEAIGFMVVDGRGRVLYNDLVTEGEVSEVPLYVRRLVHLCIEHDAYTAILAHNHPSGNPLPSRNDIVATRQVDLALRGINVTLQDHIIYAGETYFTFSGTQPWKEAQLNAQNYYRQQLDLARIQEQEYLQHGNGPLSF